MLLFLLEVIGEPAHLEFRLLCNNDFSSSLICVYIWILKPIFFDTFTVFDP